MLVYLGSERVVALTVPLLNRSLPQTEAMNYLFLLRQATNGWQLEDRQSYFAAWARGRREFRGANFLVTALNHIRADAEATLTPAERRALAGELRALDQAPVVVAAPVVNRPLVRDWTLAKLVPALTPTALARNQRQLARAPRLFTEAGCAQCHRFGTAGGVIGPDLSAVGRRFDARTLLESLIEPSKVIADTYQSVTLTMRNGDIYDGRLIAEDEASITLATNPVDPDQRRRALKVDIRKRQISSVSPMPAGLLNTLNRDEILDLVSWLLRGP
jgi:putative heme-binding domain-containing protein